MYTRSILAADLCYTDEHHSAYIVVRQLQRRHSSALHVVAGDTQRQRDTITHSSGSGQTSVRTSLKAYHARTPTVTVYGPAGMFTACRAAARSHAFRSVPSVVSTAIQTILLENSVLESAYNCSTMS
jgi:propanediol dehydratase large subunit